MIIDVGQIAPAYQPGHSHADSLHFVLNYDHVPCIVDTGISTYEKNARRHLERSTSSHNTVTINGLNSSAVWSAFRVAQRAKTTLHSDASNSLEASHNGYRKLDIRHIRKFEVNQEGIKVSDELVGHNIDGHKNVGHLHFHPNIHIELKENTVLLNKEIKINFCNIKSLRLMDYEYADGFNNLVSAKKVTYNIVKSAYFVISFQ
jgi:uncharacterized heparinase superfamily protein